MASSSHGFLIRVREKRWGGEGRRWEERGEEGGVRTDIEYRQGIQQKQVPGFHLLPGKMPLLILVQSPKHS
jgi:hypothetical protein